MATLLLAAVLSAGGQPCVAPVAAATKNNKQKKAVEKSTRGKGEGGVVSERDVRVIFYIRKRGAMSGRALRVDGLKDTSNFSCFHVQKYRRVNVPWCG